MRHLSTVSGKTQDDLLVQVAAVKGSFSALSGRVDDLVDRKALSDVTADIRHLQEERAQLSTAQASREFEIIRSTVMDLIASQRSVLAATKLDIGDRLAVRDVLERHCGRSLNSLEACESRLRRDPGTPSSSVTTEVAPRVHRVDVNQTASAPEALQEQTPSMQRRSSADASARLREWRKSLSTSNLDRRQGPGPGMAQHDWATASPALAAVLPKRWGALG